MFRKLNNVIKKANNSQLNVCGFVYNSDNLSGILGGSLFVFFGLSLYIDKKSKYSESEKIGRNMLCGLTCVNGSHSLYYLIKYIKR
jgi:hypothetical protein